MGIVDYAEPCMNAEKALKNAHKAVLENNFDKAIEETLTAIVESRIMLSALRDMKEKQ